MPLKRDNAHIDYTQLKDIEHTSNYFQFNKRFIFFANTKIHEGRKIELFLDGKLKEQEKTDYLTRIETLPESFSKSKFNEKVQAMGTMAIIHNTNLSAKEIYFEYKNRGEIEQFFDHLKNTIDASNSNMQREQSLMGWMFINHISMKVIYKIYNQLKSIPLNKKQFLNHKYSIKDTIEHLKSIRKIKFEDNKYVIAEMNRSTKILLKKMKIHIT